MDIISYILSKSKKSNDEILIIKVFLSSMNFLSKLKGSFNMNKLLFSLSNYLKLEKRSKDTLLFRFGNKGNKFYILFKGEASVLILKEARVNICFKKYFVHLLLLKMLKEDELLKKTITANSKIKYDIDERDFDNYYDKIVNFANKYMTNNSKYINDLKENSNNKEGEQNKIFASKKNSEVDFNNFNINENDNSEIKNENNIEKEKDKEINELRMRKKKINTFLVNNNFASKFLNSKENKEIKNIKKFEEEEEESEDKDKIYQNLYLPFFRVEEVKEIINYYIYLKEKIDSKSKNITVKKYIKNTFIYSPFHKNLKNEDFYKTDEFTLFKYFEITKKKTGDSFGELALQREDNKRTGTLITLTDCILGVLSRNDYNIYLGDIEIKKRRNEINFIMSFSIFDKMNKIVFENRFFNFFTRENYIQGNNIIVQNQKINKVYFIMEGQFEISTNLSLFKIYSLLHQKTRRKMDNEKKKMKFPKNEFNLRLYISYNKDILGLGDFCYDEEEISFITAKCTSDKGCVFSIEKSILNEIRSKIPVIDKNINIIRINREKVMIDRLANIYNRIILTINKNQKEKFKENEKAEDSFKYLNYFFGINQGYRNKNIKKVTTQIRIAPRKRVKSALIISRDKRMFNEETLMNKIQKDNNLSNILNSKYFPKNKPIDNSRLSTNSQKDRISQKNIIKNDQSKKEINKLDLSLKEKLSDIMDFSSNQSKSTDRNFLLKSSTKFSKISNQQSPDKSIDLNQAINEMKYNEYEKFSNRKENIDIIDNNSFQTRKRNSNILENKFIYRRNCSDRHFLSFRKIRGKLLMRSASYSNINKKRIFSKKGNTFTSRNSSDLKSEYYIRNIINKNISSRINQNYNQKNRGASIALTPSLDNPINIKGKLDPEKCLKRLLGTRYRDPFISYEEKKFNKLIESFNIQEQFLCKAKKAKLKLKSNQKKIFN